MLQTETTNQRTAAEMSPNSEGRTVSPGTASNSNTVTRAFAWESNRTTPEAHTLSQPTGPLDGLIMGTGFGAQFPAQIWDRVPCASQKNGSEKESPFRTQNETATQQAILSHVPEKVAKQILAVWPELPPREPRQSGGPHPTVRYRARGLRSGPETGPKIRSPKSGRPAAQPAGIKCVPGSDSIALPGESTSHRELFGE